MEEPKSLHVSQTGENWEVEQETGGTVAQAETKEEAIEAAKEAAPSIGASEIVIHTADGRVEKEIPLM